MYETVKIPVDNNLPGFSELMLPRKVAALISGKLDGASIKISGCRAFYIRYKPETNCIIAYRLEIINEGRPEELIFYAKLYKADDFEAALGKADNHRWAPVSGLPPTLAFPEHKAIFYLFPNDCLIDGLKAISDPKKIQRVLYDYCDKFPEDEWRISDKKLKLTTVRYKPERRAVLRCVTRAINKETEKRKPLSVFLRFYGDDHGAEVFDLQEQLYRSSRGSGVFAVPRPLAYLPDRKLLVMETIQGNELTDELSGDNAIMAVTRTAVALATLHNMNVPGLARRSFDSYIEEASATSEMIHRVLPDQATEVDEIFESLRKSEIDTYKIGSVHGDFYCGQALCDDQGVTLIDFERSAAGEALLDVGNFRAYLKFMSLEGRLENAAPIDQAFLSAYEEAQGIKIPARLLNYWTAFGLFQMSVRPFRSVEDNWPEKTGRILEECLRIMKS